MNRLLVLLQTKKNILVLFFLFALINSISISAQNPDKASDARRIWLKGFDIYEKAEADEKQLKYESAIKGYEEALNYFKIVQSKYPDWNAFLIDYRIKKCNQQILSLKTAFKNLDEEKTPPAKTDTTTAPSIAELKKLEEQNIALRADLIETSKKLESTLATLAETKKEAARGVAATEQLRRLNEEKNTLEKRCQILSAELNKALEKNTSPENDPLKEKLQKQLSELSTKVITTEEKLKQISEINESMKKEIQTLKMAKTEFDYKAKEYEISIENTSKRLADAERISENLRQQLTDEQEKHKETKKENDRLLKLVQEANVRNENLNAKITELLEKNEVGALAQKLQEENKQLSKQLEEKNNEIEKLAKIAEAENKFNSELMIKNEKLEKLLADYAKKTEIATADLKSLKIKIEENNSVIENQKKDIATLTNEKIELTKTIEQMSEKLNSLSKKDADYTELTKYATEMDSKNRDLTEKLKAMQNANTELTRKNAELNKNYEDLKGKSSLTEKLYAEEKGKNISLSTEKEELKKKSEQISSSVELLKAELEKLQEQNNILLKGQEGEKISQEMIKTLEKTNRELSSELEKIKKEFSRSEEIKNNALEEKIKKFEEEITKIKAEEKSIRRDYETAKNELSDLKNENQKLNKIIDKLKSENEDLKKSTLELEKPAEDDNGEQEKQITSMKEEIDKLKKHNEALRNRLEEKIADSVYPKDFREEKQKLIAQIEEKEKEIRELKKEINNITQQQANIPHTQKEAEDKTRKTATKNEKALLLLTAAEDAEKNKDIESAIWHYQKVFEFDKSNQTATISLARIFSEKGETEKATAYLENLTPEKINTPDIAISASKISLKTFPNNLNKAKIFYERAIELGAPKDSEIENKLK